MGNSSIPMPAQATCCQCHQTRPIKAEMNLGDRSIPLLVVPQDVSSIEEALEAATCQVCLKKSGPVDRGLFQVLMALGAEDLDSVTPASRGAVVVASRDEPIRQRGAVVVQRGPPLQVAIVDPLAGTSLVLPARERPGRDRRGPPPHARLSHSHPRLPDALRDPEPVRDPEPPVEHLTGAIGESGGNAAVLEVAKGVIRQRDEAKRRERAQKFDKLLFYLRLMLARVRKNAATSEVWDLVEVFERKLWEAVEVDPASRGPRKIRAQLGTSDEEIEALCLRFYEKPSSWTRKPGMVCEKMDAFEGGRRPEFWDMKGGRKPAFYELEIVRTKSSLPIPNHPLPGGNEDPRPRIIYPEGGGYGPDYTVENSRRERHQFDWELRPFGWALTMLVSWSGDHLDSEIVCNGESFNLPDLLCWFIEPAMSDEEDQNNEVVTDDQAASEPTIAISSDLPAIT